MREALQEKEDAKNMKAKMREKVNDNSHTGYFTLNSPSSMIRYLLT